MRSIKSRIPNCITILRIIGTLVLSFLEPRTTEFLIVYTFCGFTDVLDGTLARLLKATSPQGAVLDSISDLYFYCVMLGRVLPITWSAIRPFTLGLIGCVVLFRFSVYLLAYFKFNVFSSQHTFGNKLTGFFVFLFPYVVFLFGAYTNVYCLIVALVALLATLEELFIHLTSKEYSPWRKTLFPLPKKDA